MAYNSEDIPCCQNEISGQRARCPKRVIMPYFFKKRGNCYKRNVFVRFDGCSEAVDGNCGVRKAIYFSAERFTSSYKSFDLKLILR